MRLTDLDGCVGLLSSTVSYEKLVVCFEEKKSRAEHILLFPKKNKKK